MNNGYTRLTINGEEVGIKFGLPAVQMFAEKVKTVDLFEKDNYTLFGIAYILYAGYKNNCMIAEKPDTLTLAQFTDFVENAVMDNEVEAKIKNVMEVFAESKAVKWSFEQTGEPAKKKNGPGKKLKAISTLS